MIVVGGQKNFAINPVAIVPDIFPRWFWQARELFRRVHLIEAFDKSPDPRAFADKFTGKDTQPVNSAFVDIGLDQEHGTTLRRSAVHLIASQGRRDESLRLVA